MVRDFRSVLIKKKNKGDKKGKMEETQFEIIILVIGTVIGLITGLLTMYIKYKYFSEKVGEDVIWKRYQNKDFDFLEKFDRLNLDINLFRLSIPVIDIAERIIKGEERSNFPPDLVTQADILLVGMEKNPNHINEKKKEFAKMFFEGRKGMYDLYNSYKIYFPESIDNKLNEYIGILNDTSKMGSAEITDKRNLIRDVLLNYLANLYAKRNDTKNLILLK
jgi:hypothetical protein